MVLIHNGSLTKHKTKHISLMSKEDLLAVHVFQNFTFAFKLSFILEMPIRLNFINQWQKSLIHNFITTIVLLGWICITHLTWLLN